MLEVVQPGQAGKTKFLFDMHRLRKRVFKDKLGWDVNVDGRGLEVDQFDLPGAIYLLGLDREGRVIANWRLLPTSGPTMIRDVWPEFLTTIDMPACDDVWETSRFAVSPVTGGEGQEGLAQVHRATQELFCGVTEVCLHCGITEIFTMYDSLIARLLRRLDCRPREVSAPLQIEGRACYVGRFRTDQAMLDRLRAASGITETLVHVEDLPPILLERAERQNRSLAAKSTSRRPEMMEALHG